MNEEVMKELAEIKSLVQSNKKILNMDEAAVYLGMSKSRLYKLTAARTIPHSKPTNGLLFFDRDEITNWAMGAKVIDPRIEAAKYLKRNAG